MLFKVKMRRVLQSTMKTVRFWINLIFSETLFHNQILWSSSPVSFTLTWASSDALSTSSSDVLVDCAKRHDPCYNLVLSHWWLEEQVQCFEWIIEVNWEWMEGLEHMGDKVTTTHPTEIGILVSTFVLYSALQWHKMEVMILETIRRKRVEFSIKLQVLSSHPSSRMSEIWLQSFAPLAE